MKKRDFCFRNFFNEKKYCACGSLPKPCPINPCLPKPCPPETDPCSRCVGPEGPQGEDGRSAYQVALDNGFVGTETEWLESLKGPFLSSYIEAIGSSQVVQSGEDIVFDIDDDVLDIAGNDIEIDASGSIFTIRRAGLYHVEWSANLASGTQPIVICLMENGEPVSALSNGASSGNYSSGALINVSDEDIPYEISLRNFGGSIEIEDSVRVGDTAVSIRILRFADGPNV